MITWDGVLASMQRRADLAALHLPGFPIAPKYLTPAPGGRSVALLPFTAGTGTAAGDLEPPTGVTGSHHNAATGEQS